MMPILALLVAALALGAAMTIWISGRHRRRRRRSSRKRREVDYAERAVRWRGYLQFGRLRGIRRITDQRETDD